jgi:methionine biosynthesis protein MetW
VIEQNLDKGLSNFADNSFDTVVMTQTLQAVHYPDEVLDEMLRIGKECLVSFPNFGYWRTRLYLLTKGKMPVSNFMPHSWYNTPNIHFCTVNDFEALCQQKGIRILSRRVMNQHNETTTLGVNWPNLFGATAIYRISK